MSSYETILDEAINGINVDIQTMEGFVVRVDFIIHCSNLTDSQKISLINLCYKKLVAQHIIL